MNIRTPQQDRDYIPIADHALIGNLRTAALVSIDGSIESYCLPDFDSPSIFARILDKDKGGHFSITPTVPFSVKQNYLPSSNVLQTKFLNEEGVVSVTDFLPRQPSSETTKPLLDWLIRLVEVIRDTIPIRLEWAPAFNYARSPHTMEIIRDECIATCHQEKAVFKSDALSLDLRFVADSMMENVLTPNIKLQLLDLRKKGHLGLSAYADLDLEEGQAVTFILRTPPAQASSTKIMPNEEKAASLGVSMESKGALTHISAKFMSGHFLR